MYRDDLEMREGCDVVAHERLTEPCVTMESLLAKLRSFSNLPAFLDLHDTITRMNNIPEFSVVYKNDSIEIQAFG